MLIHSSSKKIGDKSALVVKAEGRIDAQSSTDFCDKLFEILDASEESVVIDFSAVDYISSAGLRSLLLIAKRSKNETRQIVFCAMKNEVYNVIKVTGFSNFLDIFNDEAAAFKQL